MLRSGDLFHHNTDHRKAMNYTPRIPVIALHNPHRCRAFEGKWIAWAIMAALSSAALAWPAAWAICELQNLIK